MVLLKDHSLHPQSYNKAYRRLVRAMGQAISDFDLIQEGDRIMVAVSGGKDSISLLQLLEEQRRKAPVSFEIFAYTLDQAQPNYDASGLIDFYKKNNFEYYVETKDTYSIVVDKTEEGKTFCSLCSRLRRGILYNEAIRLKATKIALGHHLDDAIETLLLNLFYGGKMAAMPAILRSDDQRNILIRPLIYADEADLTIYAREQNFPIIPCNLCGNQENLKRKELKQWLKDQAKSNPTIRASIRSAIQNVHTSHLLDKNAFDFSSLLNIPQ